MNYRHAFHAGNHGDVLKHTVLTRVLEYYKTKEQGFAVLDAHAGIGHYDLTGLEAFKTAEWQAGIGKLLSNADSFRASALTAAYIAGVRAMNPDGVLRHYPGSPEICRGLLRPQDRLLLNELHPQDHQTLAARYAAGEQVRVSQLDAAVAVKAALPFAERRGIVLLDPAYEVADERERLARMVAQALKRMAQACLLVWYPITAPGFADGLCEALVVATAKSALRVDLMVRKPAANNGLCGSGLVVINPPWTLHDEMATLLPALASVLGESGQGSHTLQWLKQPT
jgi:23S rRNA (adenine2030-N6)-methyltransferase